MKNVIMLFVVVYCFCNLHSSAACELQLARHTEEQIKVINFLSQIEKVEFTGGGDKCLLEPWREGKVLSGAVCVSEPNKGYSGFAISFFNSPDVGIQIFSDGLRGGYQTWLRELRELHEWGFSQAKDYRKTEILKLTGDELIWRYQSSKNEFVTISLFLNGDKKSLVRFHALVEKEQQNRKNEIVFKYICY